MWRFTESQNRHSFLLLHLCCSTNTKHTKHCVLITQPYVCIKHAFCCVRHTELYVKMLWARQTDSYWNRTTFYFGHGLFFPAIITSDKNQKMCSSPARCDSHRAALCKTSAPTLVSFGGRLPVLCTDHRQAHLALLINVGVVDLCLECDLGRLERVLGGENDFNPECTFVIRRVVLKGNQ